MLLLRILRSLSWRVSSFNETELRETSACEAMLQAAKCGIVEFVTVMSRHLMWTADKNKRGVFAHVILNRHKMLFKLLLKEAGAQMSRISPLQDAFGNNMLHQVAEFGPSSDIDPRFGAALQMQSEIQWFKVIH